MKQKFLLLFSILATAVNASGFSFSAKNNDGITIFYNILSNEDLTCEVTLIKEDRVHEFYGCYSGDISIPSIVTYGEKNYSVTTIGSGAFSYCNSLTSVTIPNSVTTIGGGAFYGCSSLKSFLGELASEDHRCLIVDGVLNSFAPADLTSYKIPESVTEIGNSAFSGCSGLTSVEIPNSVTTIGGGAFSGCSNLKSFSGKFASEDHRCLIVDGVLNSFAPADLTSYVIPNSVTSIGSYAFYGCSSLVKVTIPNSVTSIEDDAFCNCTSLTSVVIPNSVTSIGMGAFHHCSSLTSVTIPESVTSIGYIAFSSCFSLTSVEIPNSVTSIGGSAFYNCSSLTSVTIPNSVTTIGYYAFYDCSGLTSVTVENDNPANISLDSRVFYNVPTSTCVLYVPAGSKELYAAADQWKEFSTIKEISNSSEENNIIYYTSSDGNVVTPYKTDAFGATIVSNTYENGQGKIVFDGDVTTIGLYAFLGCSKLTSVKIPNSVTSIGVGAFFCSGLTSVKIPNSVTTIGGDAFEGCHNMKSLTVENSDPANISLLDDVFRNFPTHTCVLYVPAGSKELYAAADQWKEFSTIKEISNSSEENNIIYYTSWDGQVVEPNKTDVFGATILSNTYENGQGKIVFDGDVTSIGEYAFDGCSKLTSVEIPNSVTSIGGYAFSRCSKLTSVEIPESVTSIGGGVFSGCSNLKSFSGKFASDDQRCLIVDGVLNSFAPAGRTSYEIPNSVTSIGNHAFSYCTSLTSVEIPNSVTKIGNDAFGYCSSLTSVEIPNSVTSIGWYAFSHCSSLTSVTIPNSVTSIGGGVFSGCSNLKSFSGKFASDDQRCLIVDGVLNSFAPAGRTSYEIPNSVTSIGNDAFGYCSSLTSVEIPNSVTSIGGYAFSWCSSLTSVEIPESVTSIGYYAFEGCYSLTSVTVENDNPTNISLRNNVFIYVPTSTCVLYVPAGSKELYAAAEQWKEFQNIEEISNSSQENNIIYYTSSDEQVVEPYKTDAFGATIKSNTYENGQGKIVFDGDVTSIGNDAFNDCKGLTSVEIPNSVTSIGVSAFQGCKGLISVEIPESVTSIGEGAFEYCSSLESFSGKFASEDNRCLIVDGVLIAFARVGLTSYKIPNSVTSIGKYAFEYCSSLTSVTIPNSVTSIGSNAFFCCFGLTSVTIPNSVTSIGVSAFQGCSALTSVEIGNSVTSIGEGAFFDCTSLESFSGKFASEDNRCLIVDGVLIAFARVGLTSYEIPISVTTIGRAAFSYCSSLTSVTIPNSVTSIGASAFHGCSSLTSVTIPNSVTSIGFAAFRGCSGLTSVEIGNSVTSIGSSAFSGCSALTSVEIGNSVTTIGGSAFADCSSLTSVTVENDNPANILGNNVFSNVPTSTCVLYVPAGSKELYAAADQWKDFQNIVERATIDAVTDETTVSTENLIEQDLTDNVVDNVYYNLNDKDSGYDSTDGSIVIGSTTNMNEIADKEPGSADVAQDFNGLILKVAKGQGTITVNVKTTGNAQLVVQVGNQTPMIATRTEKGDVMVSYDVEEDTYVYIYAIIGSSYARTRGEAAEDDAVKIYGIKITPGVVNDINGDGNVDISDVVVLVNMVLEGSTDASADINGDGEVDISDVVTLVNMILSK